MDPARTLRVAAMLLVAAGCAQPPAQQAGAPAPEPPPTFVDRVWRVAESADVAPGHLYVFLSDGTLVIAFPNGKPSLGTWSYDGRTLTMVEEGLSHPADILSLTRSEFRIRSHNPAGWVDIRFVPADDGRPGAAGAAAARIESLRARLAELRTVQGTSTAGDHQATWTAYVDGSTPVHIREESKQGEYGSSRNEYWFENGVLIAFDSRGTRTATGRAPVRSQEVTLRLGFDGTGVATERTKTVDGQAVAVDSTEVTGVRARAAALATQAARLAAAPPPAQMVFRAPPSRAGRLVMTGGMLRFVPCGETGPGLTVSDLPDGEGAALLKEFGAGERGVAAMVRLDGIQLREIRYAGPEGPDCDRLPPEGLVEARGNEPFWFVRVDRTGALFRTPEIPNGVRYEGGRWDRVEEAVPRWLYRARRTQAGVADTLTLELTEARCADGMSGARYPLRAVVTRGGKRMEGCALEGRLALPTDGPR